MFTTTLVLLLAMYASALHIEQIDDRMSHSALYDQAEAMANVKNDSIVLISYTSSRVGVGFPRCRMASIYKAKRDVNRLLATEDEEYYSLLERVNTLLVPRMHKMRSAHCLATIDPNSPEGKAARKSRFSTVIENPVEATLTFSMTALIVVLIAVVGGKCLGDLSRHPVSGRHSLDQIPRTLWRVACEAKNTQFSDNWKGEKVD